MSILLTHINGIPIYRRPIYILPKNKALTTRARELRKAGNLAEVIFWKQVHQKKFHKIDFDRQRVIGNFIVDFYIKSLRVVIEIDGKSHIGKEEYDAKRENFLKDLGLEVYRISDYNVKNNLDRTMKELENYLIENFGKPTPPFA